MTSHCIYIITNTTTGKVYVGRTHNFNQRVSIHKSKLKYGRHSNKALQIAFNAGAVLEYQVIDEVEALQEARLAEVDWIKAFPEVYNDHKRVRQ